MLKPSRSYLLVGEISEELLDGISFPELKQVAEIDRLVFDGQTLKITELRQGLAAASQKPLGVYRLLLIIKADELKETLQNTLLKFLEEPPSLTIVLLQANDSNKLLPTVKSRLEQIILPGKQRSLAATDFLFDQSSVRDWLGKADKAEMIAAFNAAISNLKNLLLDGELEVIPKIEFLDKEARKLKLSLNQKLFNQAFLLRWQALLDMRK